MGTFLEDFKEYIYFLSIPKMTIVDLLEIVIIAFAIYSIILWVKNTRAWSLVKGILVLFLCYLFAYLLDMSVILWIFDKTIAIGITAVMIVFQPELRRALEELGRKNLVRTVNEIVKAVVELAKVKTGALIIIEKDITLAEYERTGINIDSAISSQLLINIFEHNTPLHDGAVIIRGNRIVAATCYLPLSDNLGLSKELGTRHRAGVGVSEASDSLTIIVSEETGKISVATGGKLLRNIDGELLKKKMAEMQGNPADDKKKRFSFNLKARGSGEKGE